MMHPSGSRIKTKRAGLDTMGGFLPFVYYLATSALLPLIAILAGFHSLVSRDWRGFYAQRFGLKVPEPGPKKSMRVWLHAVSVGEVLSCRPLIALLGQRGVQVFLSTGTRDGLRAAATIPGVTDTFLLPLDHPLCLRPLLDGIAPDMVLLCEMEIWPALIWGAERRGIPLYLISGRLGEREFIQYHRFRFFFRDVLRAFDGLFMQSARDADRIRDLVRHGNVKTMGSLKYDVQPEICHSAAAPFSPGHRVIFAASTHRQEERHVVVAFARLITEFPELRLLLVPRHPKRTRRILALLSRDGLEYTVHSMTRKSSARVHVVDTMGDLPSLYSCCDLVVMGGSFSPKVGGHNIIEPAVHGKCILCGPHMKNFEDVFSRFRDQEALLVTSKEKLEQDLRRLLRDPAATAAIGRRALELVKANRGVAERIVSEILGNGSEQSLPSDYLPANLLSDAHENS